MRLVCSYCRKVIRHDAGSRVLDVSHGMCPSCAEHFGKLWKGMPLCEYLDTLDDAAVVMDGHARIIGANLRLAALLGRARSSLPGLRCGEAFACVHAREPRGCGKGVRCRECAVRNAVAHVHESGMPVRDVPASLETHDGRLRLTLSARAEQGLVKLMLREVRARAGRPAR